MNGYVAIDGKTLRRSFRTAGSGVFVHMVSAWATRNRVVLGQIKTDEKSNEITAIPELLGLLSLKGCIVTIDAMGCQKDIATAIIAGGAEYCLAVKDNQPKLRADLVQVFDAARTDPAILATMDYFETHDKGHGRVEARRCWTTSALDGMSQVDQWTGLRSIALIEVDRTVGGKTSTEQRYVISSCKGLSAAKALETYLFTGRTGNSHVTQPETPRFQAVFCMVDERQGLPGKEPTGSTPEACTHEYSLKTRLKRWFTVPDP